MKKTKRENECVELNYGKGKTTGCPTVVARETFWHDRLCGFTLVELVIVIAIVIILSVISVPIYRGYVDKSKIAEGYALLGAILSAQKAYYSEYGNFLGAIHSSASSGNNYYTDYETILGIDARGNKYFTEFRVGSGDTTLAKYYFNALVYTPKDLRKDGNVCLLLQYNITLGNRIIDYDGQMNVNDWQ